MPPPAQAGGMGERCKLPHWGLGPRPRSFAICATFMFKSHTKFYHFSPTAINCRLESFMKECNYVVKVLYFNGFTVNVLHLASLRLFQSN